MSGAAASTTLMSSSVLKGNNVSTFRSKAHHEEASAASKILSEYKGGLFSALSVGYSLIAHAVMSIFENSRDHEQNEKCFIELRSEVVFALKNKPGLGHDQRISVPTSIGGGDLIYNLQQVTKDNKKITTGFFTDKKG